MIRNHEELAKFLKERRLQLNLSQIEVARKLGYSTAQFVSNWERGLASPPLDALTVLIDLYKVSPNKIIQIILDDMKTYLEHKLKGPKRRSGGKNK